MVKDRPFLVSGILGLGAIAMTLILAVIGPREFGELPPGFITPVIGFEFAESPAEVWQMFRPPGAAEAMDRVNRWDFLFMVLYGLFLASFAVACARQTGNRTYFIAAALAGGIVLADVLENIQLFALTYRVGLDGGHMDDVLARLRVYTWVKWGGLAAYFLLLWPYFRGRDSGFARFIAYAGLLPAALALLAFFRRGLLNELMVLAVALMFVLMTLYAWGQVKYPRLVTGRPADVQITNG